MAGPFEGVKVVEIAAWTFVPGSGAIMADLGADVIKIEPPTGDPQRGLMNALNSGDVPNAFLEIPNRGKRSVTLDLRQPEALEVLHALVHDADVLLTSYLPNLRTRLKIDVEDLRTVNPKLIYVRGSGWGSKGPKSEVGGFDSAAAWSAGGTQHKLTDPGAASPVMQPAAYYDLQGSNTIAGAVAMALFRRERTGEGSVVDVSLLNTGMWPMSPDLTASPYLGEIPRGDRRMAPNPIVNLYRTKDDRWINLVCLQSDRHWDELCLLGGRVDLVVDERFGDAARRFENREECVRALDQMFGSRTMAEWAETLASFGGVWSTCATFEEIHADEQVAANGYLPEIEAANGSRFRVVSPPYQFDNQPTVPQGPAPTLGQHTDEVLREAGISADRIDAYRSSGLLG